MSVNEIKEEIRSGKRTPRDGYNAILPFADKLTDSTYDSVIAGLPALGTEPEHVKTYFDMLDKMLSGSGIPAENNLLGETPLERAKNYNKYHKAFSDVVERNPDMTIDQTDAAFKKIVGEPVAKAWVLKAIARFMSPAFNVYSMIGEIRGLLDKDEAAKGVSGPVEPKNVGEFEFEVKRMAQSDKKAAKEYYDKWANKW
jgi:hypothetical protein